MHSKQKPCVTRELTGSHWRPFWAVEPIDREPPADVVYILEESLDLLAALEDSRDVLTNTDHLSVLSQVEHQLQILSHKLGLDEGGPR
jgi:hypothetical protein